MLVLLAVSVAVAAAVNETGRGVEVVDVGMGEEEAGV